MALNRCKLTEAEVSSIVGFPVHKNVGTECRYTSNNPAGNSLNGDVIIQQGESTEAAAKDNARSNFPGGTITDVTGFKSWAFIAVSPAHDHVEMELDAGQHGGDLDILVTFTYGDPTAAAIALAHKLVG